MVKSWKTCPKCKDRKKKIYHANRKTKPFECQKCKTRYEAPPEFDIMDDMYGEKTLLLGALWDFKEGYED